MFDCLGNLRRTELRAFCWSVSCVPMCVLFLDSWACIFVVPSLAVKNDIFNTTINKFSSPQTANNTCHFSEAMKIFLLVVEEKGDHCSCVRADAFEPMTSAITLQGSTMSSLAGNWSFCPFVITLWIVNKMKMENVWENIAGECYYHCVNWWRKDSRNKKRNTCLDTKSSNLPPVHSRKKIKLFLGHFTPLLVEE